MINEFNGDSERNPVQSRRGFTLIELIVVIAIVGILAAIAVPQFALYRKRSYDSDVKSNLRNLVGAQEAYFTDNLTYQPGPGNDPVFVSWGFRQSENVTVTAAATVGGFVITGTAAAGCSAGTGVWSFDSASGTIVGTVCN